jgi:UDP-glucose 4-epimerase
MREELVVARFVQAVLESRPITIAGTGEQQRNYVYVEDLADAHVLALDERAENETFNLEGPEPVSIRRVAEVVRSLVNPLLAIEFVPGRPGDYAGRQVSAEKASRVLGWEARTSFEEGMRRYTDWWMEESEEGAPQAGEV